jgi:hypothetical protein
MHALYKERSPIVHWKQDVVAHLQTGVLTFSETALEVEENEQACLP